MAFSLIDISRTLYSSMAVWPGAAPFRRKILYCFDNGDGHEESSFSMNIHTGTHLDRPSHFVRKGASMDTFDLRSGVGRCRVVACGDRGVIDLSFVESLDVKCNERILFQTRNSLSLTESFDEHFVALSSEAAEFLAERRIRLVGVDGPSVQLFHDTSAHTHEVLLGADVVVIENLILKDVPVGEYGLLALPLKIAGAEGAPLRAVLVQGDFSEGLD